MAQGACTPLSNSKCMNSMPKNDCQTLPLKPWFSVNHVCYLSKNLSQKKSFDRKMAQDVCIPLLNPKSINDMPKDDHQTLSLKPWLSQNHI